MKGFSKEGQDAFVHLLLPKPGFFLDIGCAEPIIGNNTYFLEQRGWKGILIDKNLETMEQCKLERYNPSYWMDVTKMEDWTKFLEDNVTPNVIDYISLDVDDANIHVMQNFPFDEYEFKIMTYETDNYNNDERQNVCKEVLSKYPQYEILLENAQLEDGRPWEDWWVNERYIDNKFLEFKNKNMYWKDFLEKLK